MPKVTYLPTGRTYEVAAGTRYYDFCQENDVPHPYGCTVGSCGTCCSIIESGAEHLDPPSKDERETLEMRTSEPHARLGCQLVIRGDLALRPIDD
jgi:ferredoxin, 2Fe-2S